MAAQNAPQGSFDVFMGHGRQFTDHITQRQQVFAPMQAEYKPPQERAQSQGALHRFKTSKKLNYEQTQLAPKIKRVMQH